jgi:geranylgeranyl pyrophosphate synthase
MASTVLEATRVAHEDLERLERLAARELQREPANLRDRLFQSHRVRHMLDHVVSTSGKLVRPFLLFLRVHDCIHLSDSLCLAILGLDMIYICRLYYEKLKEVFI